MEQIYPSTRAIVNSHALSSAANTANLPSPADCIDYTARMIYTLCYRLAHGEGYHGRAIVRIDQLAEMRGVSPSTVDKALSRLRRNHWIHTSRRKCGLFITPLVRLSRHDFIYLEDPRTAPAKDTAFSPVADTFPLRLSSASSASPYKRNTKSNQSTEKKQNTKTESVAGSVDCSVSASLKDPEIVTEAEAVEPSPIPAESKSETLENTAALDDTAAQLVAELKAEGVRGEVAAAIVREKQPRQVSRNLTYARRMKAAGNEIGNLAGYVVAAIRGDYAKGLDLSQVGVKSPDESPRRSVRTFTAPVSAAERENWPKPSDKPSGGMYRDMAAVHAAEDREWEETRKREAEAAVMALPGYKPGLKRHNDKERRV